MRNLAILTVSSLFLFAAGCGGKDEDCSNGADDDGDGAADCDDSECAADAACVGGGDEETDCSDGADDDGDGDIDCDDSDCDGDSACQTNDPEDCTDQVDNDDDGLTDCQDDDCACEILGWFEIGEADVSAGYDGTSSWSYDITEGDARNLCTIDFDLTDVGDSFDTACPDCEFAFMVEIANSTATAGDCAGVVGWEDGSADGSQYGYGFARTYSYGSYDYTDVMMYYSSSYAAWYPVTDDATLTGNTFNYNWAIGYYYYY